ncbi:MAG: flagellar biosynthesis protein FlhB [Chthonomonas sp.]|nr:flagellar biosynthesis protein FlhB [Chthonomonas sp.]
MGGNDGQERTEEATPKRKEDARKKGTVAKSTDLNGSILLLILVAVLPGAMGGLYRGIVQGFELLATTKFSTKPEVIIRFGAQVALPIFAGVGLLFAAMMVGGVVTNGAQVGFKATPELLKPDLQKMNPLNGFKRMFSAKATFEGFKAVAKATLFGFIAYRVIQNNWLAIIGLAGVGPGEALGRVGSVLLTVAQQVAIAWLILAVIDYMFQRKQVDKQIKMTKDELKREMKEQEGSPEAKGERMRRARKLSQSRGLKMVAEADVIVTNPTHFSVAIKYDRSDMHAPMIVAKGVDHLAFKIRELAKKNNVPIVENPPLARALYKQCEVGDFVPRELFATVAEVLAYVYKTLKNIR